MSTPSDKRWELIQGFKKEKMAELGYVKLWYALTYRLLKNYDHEHLLDRIYFELESFGICPSCLGKMPTRRVGTAAGDVENEYYCPECPGNMVKHTHEASRLEKKIVELWKILDNIDTAGDAAKDSDAAYRSLVEALQRQRWEVLTEDEIDALYDKYNDQ